MKPDNLKAILEETRKRIGRFLDRSIGEQNTKASLIEPLLEALGWDIRDPDEVHREFRGNSKDNPVDYALKLLRKPRLLVEAKGLGEDLSDRKWIAQVLGYATVTGVEWCVLTDGNRYRIFNATAAVDADEKLFCEVMLSKTELPEAARTLSLISRPNLEENLLNVFWENHFSDRRVKAALQTMIASTDSSLVRLLKKSIPALTAKQIYESLMRLDIKIDLMEFDLPKPSAEIQIAVPNDNSENNDTTDISNQLTQEQQFERADNSLKELFNSVRQFTLSLGDDVIEKTMKCYVGYRRKSNFFCCQIQSKRQRLRTWLALCPDTIKASPGFVRDVRNVGHQGTGNAEITIATLDDLEKAKSLIAQSYRENQ